MTYDLYRVNLFKKKIRSLCDEIEGMRFNFSIGKTHLVFNPIFYTEKEEVIRIVMDKLTKNNIEFIAKKDCLGLYRDRPEEERPIDYISIPIDQPALPERKLKTPAPQKGEKE